MINNLKLSNGWYYIIEDDTVTIMGRTDDGLELVIPPSIDSLPVRRIGEEAFYEQKITRLMLPFGITSIGRSAFMYHHIRNLIIPDLVCLIENGAFFHNCFNLFESVTIPANVKLEDCAIDEGFVKYYNSNEMKAGVYLRKGYYDMKDGIVDWDYYNNKCSSSESEPKTIIADEITSDKKKSEKKKNSAGTDHIAKITDDHVKIFGKCFPLIKEGYKKPFYYIGGELKSFEIPPTIISYMGRKIPVCWRMFLYRDGVFHGACINKEYQLEHDGIDKYQLSDRSRITFYPNGNVESFKVKEYTETHHMISGRKLVLNREETLYLHETNGYPKRIIGYFPPGNWWEIDENFTITGCFTEKSSTPDYD